MKRILAIASLFVLVLGLVIAVFLVLKQTQLSGKAVQTGIFSPENSYLFASPLSAAANGQEKIRVTIFLLDTEGRGLPDKLVFLGQDSRLTITFVQNPTDSYGRAIFDLSSGFPAEYLIEAQAEGKILPQRVKVSFRWLENRRESYF